MAEISLEIPNDLKELVQDTDQALYVEALKEVAFKRMSYNQKRLRELQEKINELEQKYQCSYEDFASNMPDSLQAHEDWIEWTFLIQSAEALSQKIQKLSLLAGHEAQ